LRHPKRRRVAVLNMCGILLYCYLRWVRYGRPIFSRPPSSFLAPLPLCPGKQRILPSLLTADASERSDGQANGSDEWINVQLDARQGKCYMRSDRVARIYESLTTLQGFAVAHQRAECGLCCCRSAAAVVTQPTRLQSNSMLRPR
jgi:hypothetical protein